MWTMPSWGISVTPRLLRHDGRLSISERPWPPFIPHAIWMLRAALYLSNVIVYSGISVLWNVHKDIIDRCSMMAGGRFLTSLGIYLYHPQYECLGLLWVTSLYTRVYRCSETWTKPSKCIMSPLDCCGIMFGCRFLNGHGLNIYHLQYEILKLRSIWVTCLYTRVHCCFKTWTMPSWVISETPSLLRHDGWSSLSERQWLRIWVTPLHTCVYRCFEAWTKLGYLWDPLLCFGTMADGRFLKSHSINLYHQQYEYLRLPSIWITSFYTLVYQRLRCA